ncbi:MAG: dephospho-CoA kinase [Pseudomonadota bacterium]
MLTVAITGSIGMGKSTAAKHFRACSIPVCDADALVHELYAGPAVAPVEAAFPGTTHDGCVDRAKLSGALLGDADGWSRLEAIIHPMVRQAEADFLHTAFRAGAFAAAIEIPLLFETGADGLFDRTLVVSSPYEMQRQRVLARQGMSEAKFASILKRQLSDAEKRSRADFVVDTSGPLADTADRLDEIVDELKRDAAGLAAEETAYHRHWRAILL